MTGFAGTKQQAALAKAAGANPDQIAMLLAMAAPAILAGLCKAKQDQGLDDGALAGLVKSEATRVHAQTPKELSGLLKWIDADGDGNVAEDIAAIASKALGGLFRNN